MGDQNPNIVVLSDSSFDSDQFSLNRLDLGFVAVAKCLVEVVLLSTLPSNEPRNTVYWRFAESRLMLELDHAGHIDIASSSLTSPSVDETHAPSDSVSSDLGEANDSR